MLGRISHIDDKLIPATSWTDFTKKWNDCYMHSTSRICRIAYPEVITNGARWIILFIKYTRCIESYPKNLGSLVDIPFPRTLRSMQSFLYSLNFYSRFIKYFAGYASVLYEQRKAVSHEIRRVEKMETPTRNEKRFDDWKCQGDSDPGLIGVTGGIPKTDERKSHAGSDPGRICVIGAT